MERGKIITTLRQRRQIEQQIHHLMELKSENEIAVLIDTIVAQGSEVIPTILANLETTDPHFRGALGLVAAYLPREDVVTALQGAAQNESSSDQARLTAMMILERFLEEEVDAAALTHLNDPDQVAMQSLLEVTSESRRDRAILIEYVRGLQEQPAELTNLVLNALKQIPAIDQVELLRMLAQDERSQIRDQALAMLSQNRTPASRRAVQTLLPTSPTELQPALNRALRKLTFAGVPDQPLPAPDPSWRALVSPIDGRGNQSIWFLQEYPNSEQCRFLSVLISDQIGIQEAFGGDKTTGQHFPTQAPIGTLHAISLRASTFQLNLLEADFDYGRRLVLAGLQVSFEKEQPLPIEYRLLNDLIWGYSAESLDTNPTLPKIPQERFQSALASTADLLDIPDFTTWFVQSELIYKYAERLRSTTAYGGIAAVPIQWILEIADAHFASVDMRRTYIARLRAMSEWLLLSNQGEAARLALVAALAIDEVLPSEHPFLLRLVQHGLGIAINNLNREGDDKMTSPDDA